MIKIHFLILYFVVLSVILGNFLYLGRQHIVELLSQVYFVSILAAGISLFYEKS